jgi:L-rhamnose mutarotase
LVRSLVGPDVDLSVVANQAWDVEEAIANVRRLAPYGIRWIEEPTSPDDVLGHRVIAEAVAPVRVASGEHIANRVVFKQMLASGAIDVCQIDACRVAGVNENVAILVLAAKFGVPVCPHAGGVGLCEVVQHLAMFDLVAVSGSTDGRWLEFVDHLHEHFVNPVRVSGGRYAAPLTPGSGAEIRPETLRAHRFPDGEVWAGSHAAPPTARLAGPTVRRVASVIRLRPEREAEYRALHSAVWPGVLDRLRAAQVTNYSIFLRDGMLFSCLEYLGDDLEADLALIAADETTQAWWRLTDPCQEPVPTAAPGERWAPADEVFHLD